MLSSFLSDAQNAAIFAFLAGFSFFDFKNGTTIVAVFLLA